MPPFQDPVIPEIPQPTIPGQPGGPWSPENIFTPGNVARGAMTAAGVFGNLAAQRGANQQPPGSNTNPANNPAVTEQTTQDILSHGAPTPDQMKLINDSIDQLSRQSREAILQASANSGQGGENSMLVQDKLGKLNQDLALLKETMIQKQAAENVGNALKELGILSQSQLGLAQLMMTQNTQAQQTAAGIMESIMYLYAH
jgi:hypothetical protein